MKAQISILAAMVATAAAYGTMQTPDGECFVKGDYDKARKEWQVTLGDCGDDKALQLEFLKQGGHLETDDGLCMGSDKGSKKAGVPIVLAKCNDKPSKKWIYLSGDHWAVQGLCMRYSQTKDAIVQDKCGKADEFVLEGNEVEPKGPSAGPPVQPTATVTVAPVVPTVTVVPPPPPPAYTCGNWVGSVGPNACPTGYTIPSNYYGLPCSAPNGCVAACCVPVIQPSYRTCGQFAVQNGGPNACGKYGQLTPYLDQPCTTDRNCLNVCCAQAPPPPPKYQTCGSWFVKNGGPNACGMGAGPIYDLSQTCSSSGYNCQSICCDPIVSPTQTCIEWSNQPGGGCPTGSQPIPNGNVECKSDGSNCEDKCCVPFVNPFQTCQDWFDTPNTCLIGTEAVDDPANTNCASNGSNCRSTCCPPLVPTGPSQTCGNWADAGNKCAPGTTQWPNIYIACASDGSTCQANCCRQL